MKYITIEHFIIENQREFSSASGEFSQLLTDIAGGSKIIASLVRKTGLAKVKGVDGSTNKSGDEVQKLDMVANEVFTNIFNTTGRFGAYTSEESDEVMLSPVDGGKYIVHIDPIDGSSNIDVNVAVGTIFSVYKRTKKLGKIDNSEVLRPGREQVAAGYVLYGSSTVMVFTTGNGVHEFTLDPDIGDFILSSEKLEIPSTPAYYSINEGYSLKWDEVVAEYVLDCKRRDIKARYVGSLVADFHRNLLKGGIYLYPADVASPKGKLRLMYEANPMAMIVRQAGGLATNGRTDILDLVPQEVHERTPLFIGDKAEVLKISSLIKGA